MRVWSYIDFSDALNLIIVMGAAGVKITEKISKNILTR